MWIDFKERRRRLIKMDSDWGRDGCVGIGEDGEGEGLGGGGEGCGGSGMSRIQEKNVELEEEVIEEGTEAEEEEPGHKSGEERSDESGEDQSECSRCSRCLEGDEI